MKPSVASLAIIGSYPPPYGGVTTHTQRLCAILDENGIDYVVYNAGSDSEDAGRVVSVSRYRRLWMFKYLLLGKEPAVYLMSRHLLSWFMGWLLVLMRGKLVVIRLQDSMLLDSVRRSWIKRTLVSFVLKRISGVVCVNRALAEMVVSLGVALRCVHWFPGFLPPTLLDREPQFVAPEVWKFMENRCPRLVANGKVDWNCGEDLYGLDHLVELASRLKPDYPQLGIVVCFWDHWPEDQNYLDQLIAKAVEKGVANNILFNTQPGLFVPVLEASDLFVRPTNTDGDANSIREALYLGIPTVTSDAVERPQGVLLFRTRNIDHFEAQVRSALLTTQGASAARETYLAPEDRRRIESYTEFVSALAERTLSDVRKTVMIETLRTGNPGP